MPDLRKVVKALSVLLIEKVTLKFLILILLLSCGTPTLAAPYFTAEEHAYIRENPEVRIGLVADDEPFSFQERGQLQGFSYDVMKQLEVLTGLNFVLRMGNWSEIYSSFLRGDLDVIDAISYTEERNQFIQFTAPYHKRKTVLFARAEAQFTSLFDHGRTLPLRVGVIRNIYYQSLLQSLPHIDVIEYVSYSELMKSLSLGWIDAVVASEFTGIFTAHKHNLSNVRVLGPVQIDGISEEDFRLGVLKTKPVLAEILGKAVAALDDEILAEIEQVWLVPFVSGAMDARQGSVLTAEEKVYLEQKGVLRMCIDPDWMPFEKLDEQGRHVGIAADFFKLFKEGLDLPIRLVSTRTWGESLEFIRDRRCDLLSLAINTPERSEYLDFTTPYLIVPNVIASSVNEPFIEDLRQVGNRPVGSVKNYAITEQLRRQYSDLNLVEVDDDRLGIRMLQRGELYGYVGTMPTIGYQIQQQRITDIKIAGRVPGDWQLSVATRNDEPLLREIFQKLVDTLDPIESEAIVSRWIGVRYEQGYDYGLLWKALLGFLLFMAAMGYWSSKLRKLNRQLNEANDKLVQLSERDSLTGLYNRRYFESQGGKTLNMCHRNGLYFSMAMVDIDHFKEINDTYGHLLGDICLVEIGRLLQEHFQRQSDTVVRYGGEEFCVFFPGENFHTLAREMEKFRMKIEGYSFPQQLQHKQITISAGVYVGIPGQQETLDDFIRSADDALYQAKSNGRNQIKEVFRSG